MLNDGQGGAPQHALCVILSLAGCLALVIQLQVIAVRSAKGHLENHAVSHT